MFKKTVIFFLTLFLLSAKAVHGQNVLQVDFGDPPVAPGAPVFLVDDMFPGDAEKRQIKVKNVGDGNLFVRIFSEKNQELKDFSQILDVKIYSENEVFYENEKLNTFFADSINGLPLFGLAPGEEKKIFFEMKFPESAGNIWQKAMVEFDISFYDHMPQNLVVNEVYYQVDEKHGKDSSFYPGDINAQISGNGPGSINIIDIEIFRKCVIVQTNTADLRNNVGTNANSGGNSSYLGNIISSSARTIVNIINNLNFNFGSCDKRRTNHEWIEIYNPTNSTFRLKNWRIADDSGREIALKTGIRLKPKEFALITSRKQTWNYWEEDKKAKKIFIKTDFGDGLGDDGDHLVLVDPEGKEADFVAWGDDNTRHPLWSESVNPQAETSGASIQRINPGYDTNTSSDWEERNPPAPGL